jgi:superfamily I DNA/RNA helicase
MLEFLRSLNEAQYEAATTLDEHSMVLSCPGSGKTKVVETKVANILATIPDAYACCTTFSREGAKEIRERALRVAKGTKNLEQRLVVSTFHSLCLKTVKKHRNSRIEIIRDGERSYHLRGAAMTNGVEIKSDTFSEAVSAIDSYATMSAEKSALLPDVVHKIREEYKKRIHNIGKVDFEDLLVEAVDLLESGKAQPEAYTHIICDEAQDSDTLMYRWLMVHAKKANSIITLMLDDDQTLYSFRNSLGVNICAMLEKDVGAKTILNGINYRSKEEVLAPSRILIDKNTQRISKDIISHRGMGGSFSVHHFQSQSDTIKLIDSLIAEDPGSWFVLCRTNADIDQIANYMTELAIPYKGPAGPPLIERPEVEAYIELLSTLESRGGHGIDMTAIQCIAKEAQIAELCHKKGTSTLLEALNAGIRKDEMLSLSSEQQLKLMDLTSKVRSWQDAVEEGRIPRAIRLSGQWLENNFPKDPTSVQTVMNMMLKRTTGDINQRIMMLQKLLEKKETDDKGSVVLMTGHSSKGLQRKNVMVWNCRDGSFPAPLPEGDEQYEMSHSEEERRVLYVAMTRAEDNLHLVYQANKVNAKRITNYHPSVFMHDMMLELGEPMRFEECRELTSGANRID